MDNLIMPEENSPDPRNQQDLFTVAPPPETVQEEIPGIVEIPVPSPDSEEPEADPDAPPPLLTNEPAGEEAASPKPPLIFSDVHPLPSRDGGRDVSPVREKKHSASVRRGTVHLSPGDFPPEANFGDLLAAARKRAGLSEEEVRRITKLSPGYFSALERSDMGSLPPPVYVTAYIRTLAGVYGLDEESAAMIRAKLKTDRGSGDVPTSLIQNLEKDGVINELEDKRLRKIFWSIAAGLALFLIIIIWVIAASLLSRPEPVEHPDPEPAAMEAPSGKPEFSREDFDALTTSQVPEASTLKMNGKRAVAP